MINSNPTISNIYLKYNYTFNFIRDLNLEGGIIVSNRILNIYGNGYTLDGDYFSRIFNVINRTVNFYNINFVNGRSDGWGGAIDGKPIGVIIPTTGKCKAINCVFINNSAEFSGALNYVDAINCVFINNYAVYSSGAMSDAIAENCIFERNSASGDGGAIERTSASNCTFINNYAGWVVQQY